MIRLLLILIAFLFPLFAYAVAGQDDRFDWSLGRPTITTDATDDCTDTARARFDWVLGQPAIVHDATANCTLATASAGPKAIIKTGVLKSGKI